MGRLGLASSLLAAFVAAGVGLAPSTAEACGGTFCDNLPQPMPIDQTGENILFVVDGPSVEAHIQINIDSQTEAEKFAWIIPVASMPEFDIGSDPLFNSLLVASVPRYSVTNVFECDQGLDDDGGGVGFIEMPDGGGASFEPELEETVGALEIAVLANGTADEMSQWLIDNDYAQDESAMPILEEYIAQGWMFAAVKLANHAGVDDIHPLVMKYDNGEPCVPLRLTRIAAKDDMEVRVFFLGDERVAPTNYKHVEVNPLKVDWLNFGSNYKEVVTLAVDQDGANGKAFVTEFAGASEAVNQFGIYDPDWNPDVFLRAEPLEVIGLLEQTGLISCFGVCQMGHPLLLGILRRYLPAPEGADELDWWTNLPNDESLVELIDLEAWDPVGFTEDIRERIVAPGFHAVELLDTWPYLTRLFTTISPGEMTVDPIFHPHPDLDPVPAIRNAVRTYTCDGWSTVTLPDGREVYLPEDADWPEFTEEMPWEEDIDELMEGVGAPIPIVDNTELIDELLADYNAANTPPGMPPGGTTGGDDGGTTSGEPGVDFPSDGTGDAGQDDLENVSSGCACQSGSSKGVGGGIGFGLGLLLAGLITRRRRAVAR